MDTNKCCKFCLGENQSVFKLEQFPEAPRAVSKPRNDTIDFDIGICKKCGLIQQISKPRLKVLYEEFKNDVVGKKLNSQKDEFINFLSSHTKKDGLFIEYGAGNCLVASNLIKKSGSKIIANDLNLDPIEDLDERVELINGDFHKLDFKEQSVDAIYSSHVFEHLEEFQNHLTKSSKILRIGGKYIIALPHFERWLYDLNLNTFTQEHPVYPFKDDLEILFANYGFEVNEIKEYQDHSLFCSFEKVSNKPDVKEIVFKNKLNLINEFTSSIEKLKNKLNSVIDTSSSIIIFGANSSGQILINFIEKMGGTISAIVDNSKLKQGNFLFGTNLEVQDPSIIKNFGNSDTVTVFVGVFDHEIINQVKTLNKKINIFSKRDLI